MTLSFGAPNAVVEQDPGRSFSPTSTHGSNARTRSAEGDGCDIAPESTPIRHRVGTSFSAYPCMNSLCPSRTSPAAPLRWRALGSYGTPSESRDVGESPRPFLGYGKTTA